MLSGFCEGDNSGFKVVLKLDVLAGSGCVVRVRCGDRESEGDRESKRQEKKERKSNRKDSLQLWPHTRISQGSFEKLSVPKIHILEF